MTRALPLLLATATLGLVELSTYACAKAEDKNSEMPIREDCCPKGKFCCGSGCLDESLRPVTFCPFIENGCCFDPEPEPEPEPECCSGKTPICCGNRCISLREATVTLCPFESECCDDPSLPPRGDCCGVNEYCCGDRCASSNPRTDVFCPAVPGGCCGPPDEEDIKKCCAQENRVCCDGACFPPGTAFLVACESDSCGCPDEEGHDPEPEEECCGQYECCDGLTCCGGDCVPGPLPPDTVCLALACCTEGPVA